MDIDTTETEIKSVRRDPTHPAFWIEKARNAGNDTAFGKGLAALVDGDNGFDVDRLRRRDPTPARVGRSTSNRRRRY